MISFEAALSSFLLLGSITLLSLQAAPPQNSLVQFYSFMQVSDYAAAMASSGEPCDFSKFSTDENYCYSCSLYPLNKTTFSSAACASIPQTQKVAASLPVFMPLGMQKITVSKFARN